MQLCSITATSAGETELRVYEIHSAASLDLKPKTAGSTVTHPRAVEITMKCSGGIDPRNFQLLTACMLKPVSSETPALPPSASITESTVLRSAIPPELHDTCKKARGHGALIDLCAFRRENGGMAAPLYSPTHPKAVGARITEFRGGRSLTEFAKQCKITVQALKNYESGIRRPNIEQAYKMWQNVGLSTDFLYHGYAARQAPEQQPPPPVKRRRSKNANS